MSPRAVTALRTGCRSADVVVGQEETHDGLTEYDAWCADEKWHCSAPSWSTVRWAGVQCRPVASARMPIVATSRPRPEPKKSPPRWVTYESDLCGVSALFPDEPTRSNQEVPGLAGPTTVEQATYGKPDGSGAMSLGCATIGKTNKSLARLLDDARAGMLSNVKGKLLSERPVLGGREVHFSIQEGEAVARVLLVGEKLLFALVVPVEAFPEQNAQRFLDSVRSL